MARRRTSKDSRIEGSNFHITINEPETRAGIEWWKKKLWEEHKVIISHAQAARSLIEYGLKFQGYKESK